MKNVNSLCVTQVSCRGFYLRLSAVTPTLLHTFPAPFAGVQLYLLRVGSKQAKNASALYTDWQSTAYRSAR